jgi:hypothetical protein
MERADNYKHSMEKGHEVRRYFTQKVSLVELDSKLP